MRRLPPMVGPVCGLAMLLACYWPVLFAGGQYGYRDAAHFYYPLYHKVQAEWEAGRVPLWDSSENAGMPLIGNPTAAVLYPGKLVFAVMPYPWAVRVYTILHTVLAFAGMVALLRSWGASLAAASISGLAYAFGAPILFQYCNIIFLVGAAWTPLGLLAVDRWLRLGRMAGLPALAVVLAMQVLGGDPESAYLVGLCAGGYAAGLAWAGRRRRPGPTGRWGRSIVIGLGVLLAWSVLTVVLAAALPGLRAENGEAAWHPFVRWFESGKLPGFRPSAFVGPVPGFPWVAELPREMAGLWGIVGVVMVLRWRREGSRRDAILPRLVGLAAAAVLGGALSAAQLAPVLEFTGLSSRATVEGPHDIYQFALEPYRLVELIWPGFYGRHFGERSWWFSTILPTISHRQWTPSLYLGAMTLALALGASSLRKGPPWKVWLSGIALVSLIGSFGEFASPLWYARFSPSLVKYVGPHDPIVVNSVRLDGWLRDGDGSPYCLLAAILPGFHTFRFPSKLFSFTAVAIAGLAGLGWDQVCRESARRIGRFALVGAVGSLAMLALGLLGTGRIVEHFRSLDAKTAFGPLDPDGATLDILLAFGQGGVVLAIGYGLIRLAGRRPRLASSLALVLVMLDLAMANASMIRTIPQAEFEKKPKVLKLIEEAEARDPSPGPFRIHRAPIWNPQGRRDVKSDDRILDIAVWERDTLQPKYGLLDEVEYTQTMGTAELYDFEWFLAPFPFTPTRSVVDQLGLKPGEKVVVYPRRGFDLWNSRYFVLPFIPKWDDPDRGIAAFLPMTEPIYPRPDAFKGPGGVDRGRRFGLDEDVQILRNLLAYPRAWIVHGVREKPPITGMTRAERAETMQEILYSRDPFWDDPSRTLYDPRRIAWVEVPRESLAGFLPGMATTPTETVKVVEHGQQRVVLEAKLEQPGLVILADVFYPGWKLTVDGRPSTILRANRMMRGATVPSGSHTLVYTYEPTSFKRGLAVSGAAIITLLAWTTWIFVRRRVGSGR